MLSWFRVAITPIADATGLRLLETEIGDVEDANPTEDWMDLDARPKSPGTRPSRENGEI
jgi:hypothetical protein